VKKLSSSDGGAFTFPRIRACGHGKKHSAI
jgi:hypothetical protein